MPGQTRVDPVLKTDGGGWGPDRSPTPPGRATIHAVMSWNHKKVRTRSYTRTPRSNMCIYIRIRGLGTPSISDRPRGWSDPANEQLKKRRLGKLQSARPRQGSVRCRGSEADRVAGTVRWWAIRIP